MSNPEHEFTEFDKELLAGGLKRLDDREAIRDLRRRLNEHIAHAAELGLEEAEEPEED